MSEHDNDDVIPEVSAANVDFDGVRPAPKRRGRLTHIERRRFTCSEKQLCVFLTVNPKGTDTSFYKLFRNTLDAGAGFQSDNWETQLLLVY